MPQKVNHGDVNIGSGELSLDEILHEHVAAELDVNRLAHIMRIKYDSAQSTGILGRLFVDDALQFHFVFRHGFNTPSPSLSEGSSLRKNRANGITIFG